MRRMGGVSLALVMWSGILLLSSSPAGAVPAFARRYGLSCSACHSAWPALNAAGWSFKMSGYRRLNGRDLEPTTKDIELAQEALTIPAIPPVAITATAGFDWQEIGRRASDGTKATRTGSSFDLESVAIFIATPLGNHLSTFLEFPLFETHAPANDKPTGPGEANATTGVDRHRDIRFETESPTFEMGKLVWNSLVPETIAPLDSLNILGGVYELPLAFSPEARRLSVRPYLVYRRRALDLLSRTPTDSLLSGDSGNEADRLIRLGEPQIQVAANGVLVPLGGLTDLGKPDALVLEYHAGVTNGSNKNADPNTEKDFFGRLAMRWWGQTLGIFGYWSPDIYDDAQRTDASIANGGIFSGRQLSNEASSVGPDLTLSLEPFAISVWLETQALFTRESDPTGFKNSFSWWGGFSQLNWKIVKPLIAYGRYDWLRGDRFDDTTRGGVTGPGRPREWAAVGGLQWYVLENFKLLAEYSRREFRNNLSTPTHQKLNEDFFTIRASLGF